MLIWVLAALAAQSTAAGGCENWVGYDAVKGRSICGPPVKPVVRAELVAFERQHEAIVRSAAQAEYIQFCGFRSNRWQLQIEGRAYDAITRDPRYARFSDAQRQAVLQWKTKVRNLALDFLGRDGRSCPSLVGAPFVIRLDRLAYPVLR